jgi:hypothetical protein
LAFVSIDARVPRVTFGGEPALGRFRRYGLTAPNIAEIAENKK